MIIENPDIPESQFPKDILEALLVDHTTGQNIIWATDDYADNGDGFLFHQPIRCSQITGKYEGIIKPRAVKAKEIQEARSKDKAEVFTPSWVCNKQNNLIDEQWFGRQDVFNCENEDHSWTTVHERVVFPKDKSWKDYVMDTRMEITCGEAPYITSRYDTVTGKFIDPVERIGILDRKFRVVLENCETDDDEWYEWMKVALQSTYGFEWQGDNLLLARENVLSTYIRFYMLRFGKDEFPPRERLMEAIDIITWNFWQMDGLKGVIPCTCKDEIVQEEMVSLFDDDIVKTRPCPGCASSDLKDLKKHTGIQCKIMDWDIVGNGNNKQVIYFHELIK